MVLDEQDKIKFIKWLEITSETCKGMAGQMESISGMHMVELAKREKIKASACLLIAHDLLNSEIMTIDKE